MGIDHDDWARIRQIVVEVEDAGGRLSDVLALLRDRGFDPVVDQEGALSGTALYNVYATQAGQSAISGRRTVDRVYPRTVSAEELREALGRRLPDYMVPTTVTLLDRMPVNANGKIDRSALPEPDERKARLDDHSQAPEGEIERQLAAIWSELLGITDVGIHDNFFDLGGHSLSAVQVVVRIQETLGVELSVADLFEAPTLSALAKRVEASASTLMEGDIESLLEELQRLPAGEAERLLGGFT